VLARKATFDGRKKRALQYGNLNEAPSTTRTPEILQLQRRKYPNRHDRGQKDEENIPKRPAPVQRIGNQLEPNDSQNEDTDRDKP